MLLMDLLRDDEQPRYKKLKEELETLAGSKLKEDRSRILSILRDNSLATSLKHALDEVIEFGLYVSGIQGRTD